MKVFALVSGGKDGCFNMLKCVQHGHEIVGIGNLCPTEKFIEENGEEMDSFMYQTVGFKLVSAIAECVQVPLISQPICGGSLHQELEYNKVKPGDEVEDLFKLISKAKERWPDLEAVSCGAVLSNYQRHRVENVCSRLGLISVAYLWQRNQADLLNEMVLHGMDVVLAKIASMGLKPSFLNKSIARLQPTFLKLYDEFGFHVCGEGGEYETLTLYCPVLFKNKRIVIDESNIVIHEDAAFAPVAYLDLVSFHVEDVENTETITENEVETTIEENAVVPKRISNNPLDLISTQEISTGIRTNYYFVPLLTAPECSSENVESEVNCIFEKLNGQLSHLGVALHDVFFVHLYVSDMELFSEVNKTYSTYFGHRAPSRACVEVPMKDCRVAMEVVVLAQSYENNELRNVLHVKSISEWAPVCIGPYSQCNQVDRMCFTAGQIPLVPETMTLLNTLDIQKQLHLSLKHCNSIQTCCESSLRDAMSCILYVATDERAMLQEAEKILKTLLHEEFGVDYIPIISVGVPRLPRDAQVEVEMMNKNKKMQCMDRLENFRLLRTECALCFGNNFSTADEVVAYIQKWGKLNELGYLKVFYTADTNTKELEKLKALDIVLYFIPVCVVDGAPESFAIFGFGVKDN